MLKNLIEEAKSGKLVVIEASSLTGSGSGVGGRTSYGEATASARQMNPLRKFASERSADGKSDAQFVAKVGNAIQGVSNPWGYSVQADAGVPNIDTVFWSLPVKVVAAQIPVRNAVIDDVEGIAEILTTDVMSELYTLEGLSMARNNDQAASTTNSTGASLGLRGLDSYLGTPAAGSSSNASYGTSGYALTNGIHSIATIGIASQSAVTYNDITNLVNLLPPQYWMMEGTCFQAHPNFITQLRQLKDTQGLPLFLEIGDYDAAAVGMMFGFPVIPNANLSTGAGAYPLYLGNWPSGLEVVDNDSLAIKIYEEFRPGFATIYAEKRVASSVKDPFAIVRLRTVA